VVIRDLPELKKKIIKVLEQEGEKI